jgi:transcription-repair coupling factor (superfamily II helicase)
MSKDKEGLGLDALLHALASTTEYKTLKDAFARDVRTISVDGLNSRVVGALIAALRMDLKSRILVVAPNDGEAREFMESCSSFTDAAVYVPARELALFDSFAHSRSVIDQRVAALCELLDNTMGQIFVAPVEALSTKLAPPAVFRSGVVRLEVGGRAELSSVIHELGRLGYMREDLVENPAAFSVRGGILDVYPIDREQPVRVEFFDDEIDSIRTFDPESQRSVDKMSEVLIRPATEFVLDPVLSEGIMKRLDKRIRKKNLDEKFMERLEEVREAISRGYAADDYDKYYPLAFDGHYSTLMDYLGPDDLIVILDDLRVHDRYKMTYESYLENYKTYLESGRTLPEMSERIPTPAQLFDHMRHAKIMTVDALIKRTPDFIPVERVKFETMESPPYYGKIELLVSDLARWLKHGQSVLLTLSSESRRDNVAKELQNAGIPTDLYTSGDVQLHSGRASICLGTMSAGFQLMSARMTLLTDREIFGAPQKRRTAKSRSKGQMIKSFNELTVGSLVVHETHGIGRYIGVDQLTVDGLKRDYIKIGYSGDDFLYVPVENMDTLQNYVGAEESSVKLSRLGTAEWSRAKAKVKKAIEDMTDELVALYAARNKSVGYAFAQDNDWQKNFEDMFPYEETPDQLRCIEEIKRDMEIPRPMERLLCGDVGYGKTEVAIRAVFKAVMDGKQVAFLVPTTILAQQHYNTLLNRFSKYPVRVEMLSRFRSKKQQEKIIDNLRVGLLDVVVGTHRLLSKDVVYKDLGLLIVDEEQRFGVRHKESVKKLKTQIDVLTLTATPIPRTLHMSLSGIRDMSLIEDPPEDRYPIQTYVVEYDAVLIREWILREVDRGGQVFFVHNRVQDIDRMTAKLTELIPEVRLDFAHGQMPEHKLENLMMSFINHEFDVLVCTTIIETGLDMSNVNTILVNDADKMGLSQLYQLRGRVGRSNRIAYAYLMYQKDKVLTGVAEKRLKAIKEFTELGAGFKIAMKDLEIRGAGNLLGSDQSGHMSQIGYEMYSKLLEEHMRQIKGEIVEAHFETTIEFSINAFIPEDYVANSDHKLDLYKKIAGIRDQQDRFNIEEEIEDRFGTLPKPVYNLLTIAHIKAMAHHLGIHLIREGEDHIIANFRHNERMGIQVVAEATAAYGRRIAFNMGGKPYFKFRFSQPKLLKEDKAREIETLLLKILAYK